MKKTKKHSFAKGILIGALAVCGLGALAYVLSNKDRAQNLKQRALSFKDKTQAELKDKSEKFKSKTDHWKEGSTSLSAGSTGSVGSKLDLLKEAFRAGKQAALDKKEALALEHESKTEDLSKTSEETK